MFVLVNSNESDTRLFLQDLVISLTTGSVLGPKAIARDLDESGSRTTACHVSGAEGEIRTRDLPLTRRLLYQLSYFGSRNMNNTFETHTECFNATTSSNLRLRNADMVL